MNSEEIPTRVICYSGGHSSAKCAIECVRKYGKDNVILLNHDISSFVEDADIKRFKQEVADYLGLPITYANHERFEEVTPIKACVEAQAFKVQNGKELCTNRLKTAPFKKWLNENDPDAKNIYVYGLDADEPSRIANRIAILDSWGGYKSEYPMTWKERTIHNTKEIGIEPPNTYSKFKHANCIGCLKAGWQHWYIVYCERPDIWEEAKIAEEVIGHAIHKNNDGPVYLEDKEQFFAEMKRIGIEGNEHEQYQTFWHQSKKMVEATKANIPVFQMDAFAQEDSGVCVHCSV